MHAIYNQEYYQNYDVGAEKIDYETNEPLKRFLALVADRIVEDLHPQTVLDAGCAMGHLVAALRDRGVEAYGVDLSEYAISRVREDIRPYCAVGSLTEPLPASLPQKYDLVISIEVLEHLSEEDGKKAIENLCSLTDRLIFASTPDDFEDPTHINVRPREYWATVFASQGFQDDMDYRPLYLAEYAFCFKRGSDWLRQTGDYERGIRLAMEEISGLKERFGVSTQIVSVLVDTGNGYVEKERIYSCHTPETPCVDIGVTIPAGGKTLRIDPVQGYACLVSDLTVQPCEPDVSVTLREHNGIRLEDHFLFETTQPMLIYEVTGKTPAVLQIIATVTLFPSPEIAGNIRRLLSGYERQEEQIHRQENEITRLKDQLREVRSLRIRLAEMTQESEDAAQDAQNARRELSLTQQQLADAKQEIASLYDSTSWKVTAPMRACKDFFRKGRTAPAPSREPAPDPAQTPVPAPADTVCEPTPDPADMLPESLYANRPEVSSFVEKLSGHDVVSFDIFDTLLLRTFDSPRDVFRLIGHRLGEESFSKLRVQAEQEARELHPKQNGEVSIYEIYEVLATYLRLDTSAAIRQELEAEKDCCYANPFMKAVYEELLRRGQTVILVSDMYLPKELTAQLLSACGYEGYAGLYVSCDHGCGKWNGKLYQVVEREHPEWKTYVHVGDNPVSDVENSQKNGWDAVYYQACRELGSAFRPKDLDRLSISAYNGIVDSHLHADSTVYTPAYEHGFRYAGYLVCGFCEWLNRYVQENQIDRILFLARDADVICKVYNQYYRQVENRYVVTSRLATWEMAFETNTEEFIQYFFSHRADLGTQDIGTALEETDLAVLIPLLQDSGLSPKTRLTQQTYPILREFIQEHKDVAAAHFAPARKAGQAYFAQMIGDAKRVCAVDIGWSGQILITMRKILRDMYHGEVSLQGAYMALTDNSATSGYAETGIISAYLFHGCMNREIAINTATVEGDMQAKFMEATFTSDQPTLLKYVPSEKGDTEFVYGVTSADRELVHEIQRGVLDFAKLWQERTASLRPWLRIMPADAKRVFDSAITNFRYCYAILGDIREWEFPLPNFKGEGTLTTLGKMLKKRGLV